MSLKALNETSKIFDAVKFIEEHRKTIAPIINNSGVLIGSITDGDIRRAILHDKSLDSSVLEIMNTAPVTAGLHTPLTELKEKLKASNLEAILIVDENNKFNKIVHIADEELSGSFEQFEDAKYAAAIILAGGEGRRLRPLTEDLPKPMVEIGGIPLLERQIRRIKDQGITEIYLAVKYLSHVIIDHFQDGKNLDVNIHYIHENKKLGTAGAISLIEKKFNAPILVMNGDVVTTVNYKSLLDFHNSHSSKITIAAIEYIVDVPFGVIEADKEKVTGLKEKPSQRYLCNAGVYSLSPDLISKIPRNEFFNMTDLIEHCLEENINVTVFPLHEYWSDIGTIQELEKTRNEFNRIDK